MHQIAAQPTPLAAFNNQTFRILLNSLARPGTIAQLPPPPYADVPLLPAATQPNSYAVAACMSLLDQATSFAHALGDTWLAPDEPLTRWMALRSNAQVVAPSVADYVILHDLAAAGLLGTLKLGSLTFPEQSCTVFLCVPQLDAQGTTWQLQGPGIATTTTVGLPDVPATLAAMMMATRADFPLGLDIFCIDSHGACLGLPRTTKLHVCG